MPAHKPPFRLIFAINFILMAALVASVLLMHASQAHASITNPVAIDYSTTVTTSSSQILPADPSRRYLLITNVCSDNIGISITGTAAAIGSAGTVTLFPGGSMEFTDQNVPQNALNGIAGSGTCAITMWGIQ